MKTQVEQQTQSDVALQLSKVFDEINQGNYNF